MTIVRPATPADAEALFALTSGFATSYQVEAARFHADLPAILRRDDTVLLVACHESGVAGYLLAHLFPTLFAGGPILEITELAVASSERGNGYGSALVKAGIAWAKERGCVEIVVPTRRAAPFYQRFEFVVSAEYLKLKVGRPD